MNPIAFPLLATLLLSAPLAAQGSQSPLPEEQLVMRYYTARFLDGRELAKIGGALFGPEVQVKPAGTSNDTYSYQVDPILNVGDVVIVRHLATRADEILATLREVDERAARPETAAPVYETVEYAPRHVPIQSLEEVLNPFRRQILLAPLDPAGGPSSAFNSVTAVRERGLLVLRDTAANLATMRAVLERVDLPAPEVTISCLLVTRGAEQNDPRLPKVLIDNLARLIPGQTFQLLSTGLVRTAVSPGSSIELSAEVSDRAQRYTLSLRPAAHDAKTGTLAVSSCKFQLERREISPADGALHVTGRQEFETHLSLRPEEYTVLGAVGGETIFVVLRMVPVR